MDICEIVGEEKFVLIVPANINYIIINISIIIFNIYNVNN